MAEDYYDGEAVKELDRPDLVNTHLKEGWKLKKAEGVDRIIDLEGHQVLQRYLCYLMVFPKGVQVGSTPQPPPMPPKPSGPPIEVRLQALQFREFTKEGRSWLSLGPNDVPEDIAGWLKTLKDWKYTDEDGYEYTLSKSGWLNKKKK